MEKLAPRRLFIAILLPDSVKRNLGEIIGKLWQKYPELHFEKEEKLHLTLKFLGWTSLPQEKIDTPLQKLASLLEPFRLEFSALSYFFSFNFILFVDLKESQALFNLASKIEDEMEKLGFRKEKKQFRGHITLSRGKRKPVSFWKKTAQDISKEKFKLPRSFKVGKIVLIKSVLEKGGSRYTILSRYSLGKN